MMFKTKNPTLLLVVLLILGAGGLRAQTYSGGSLGIGVRTTVNLFPGESMRGFGSGGQFKLGFGPRVNTEWFFDFINSSRPDQLAYRKDYHIGWGVQFAFLNDFGGSAWSPYLIGGQCFDLTRVQLLTNGAESPLVFSAAVQAGLGVSKFLTPRLELNLQAQYMMHLTKDVHVHEHGPRDLEIEIDQGASFAGHFLTTASVSFYFLQIWNR